MTPSLPEEVLHEIFFHLRLPEVAYFHHDQNERLQTLASLALASKTFNRIANPILYRKIDAYWRPWSLVTMILDVLVKRPELAHCVVEIEAPEWHINIFPDVAPTGPNSRLNAQAVFSERLLYLDGLRHWLRSGLEHGIENAQMALLLCMCVNVQVLHLQVPLRFPHSLTALIMSVLTRQIRSEPLPNTHLDEPQGQPKRHPLSRLRDLDIQLHSHDELEPYNDFSIDIAAFACLLDIPSLSTVGGYFLSCRGDADFCNRTFPNVRRLTIDKADIDGPGLMKLLSVFPSLETLSVSLDVCSVGCIEITYSQMGDALRAHATSLMHLLLGPDESEYPVDGQQAYLPPVGSLVELSSLRRISVALPLLTGQGGTPSPPTQFPSWKDVLPVSLRRIELWGFVMNVEVICLISDTRFTKLETIELQRNRPPFSKAERLSELGWATETKEYSVNLWRL